MSEGFHPKPRISFPSALGLGITGRQEVMEGPATETVMMIEFRTFEEAKAWYESPGYKAIRHLRQDNAKYTGVLVEAGTAPPEKRLRNRIR